MSLSKIVVSGKVIREPEKRFTPNSNVAVTEFMIAVESISRADAPPESTPVKVTTWRDMAERCANDIKKGDLVAVEGRLQINKFVTAEGQNRRDVEIDALNVENLSSSINKSRGAFVGADQPDMAVAGIKSGAASSPSTKNDDLASIFASDDEIPF